MRKAFKIFTPFLISSSTIFGAFAITSCGNINTIRISSNAYFDKYLVPAETEIYTSNFDAPDTAYKCGHALIDLLELSKDNHYITIFDIVGDIDFGFLVDPSMNAYIFSSNHSKVNVISNDYAATGVVIGSTIEDSSRDYGFVGHLFINPSMTFFITSMSPETKPRNWACGLYANEIKNSLIVLGGTFSIYANDYTAYAMRIHGRAYESSHQIVVGVFHIFALRHEAAGIVIEGSINSRLDVYGIFDICSSTDAIIPNTNAYGVWIKAIEQSSVININGAFSISTIATNSNAQTTTYGSYGCYFFSDTAIPDSEPIIEVNATFSLFSSKGETLGVYFFLIPHNTIGGIPIFYASSTDRGNWALQTRANQQEYWNGDFFSQQQQEGFGAGTEMAPVYDTNNSENANLSFYIAKDLNDDTKPYGDSRYWIGECLKNYLLRKDKAYLGGKWLFNIFQHLKNN